MPIREDVLEELAGAARRSGMTLQELVEAVLGQAARVLRGRDDVASVLSEAVVYADIARLGGCPVPLDALARLLEGEEGLDDFVSSAAGLARLVALSARARGLEPSRAAALVLRGFFPVAAVDLVEEDSLVRVIMASPVFGRRAAGRLASAVAEAVLGALGFRVRGSSLEDGLVVVEASRPRLSRG